MSRESLAQVPSHTSRGSFQSTFAKCGRHACSTVLLHAQRGRAFQLSLLGIAWQSMARVVTSVLDCAHRASLHQPAHIVTAIVQERPCNLQCMLRSPVGLQCHPGEQCIWPSPACGMSVALAVCCAMSMRGGCTGAEPVAFLRCQALVRACIRRKAFATRFWPYTSGGFFLQCSAHHTSEHKKTWRGRGGYYMRHTPRLQITHGGMLLLEHVIEGELDRAGASGAYCCCWQQLCGTSSTTSTTGSVSGIG